MDEDTVKNTWEQIITNVQDLRDPIRFFRHHMMSAAHPETEGRITQTQVYDRFKQIIDSELDNTQLRIEDYVEDIEEQSQLYVDIAQAQIDLYHPSKNESVNNLLMDLNDVGGTPSRTLLLRAFQELSDPEKVSQVIKLVEDFSVRTSIAGYSTGSGVDKLYSQLATESFTLSKSIDHIQRELESNAPSDDEFRANFVERNYPQNTQTKYILDAIEREEFMNETSGKKIAGRSQAHIEHIAPIRSFNTQKHGQWKEYLDISGIEFERY